MKTRKGISFAIAAVLSMATLPTLSVGAAEYALGDVDMDGIITGHDSALVSRYLHLDSDVLKGEQLALADINEDGVVDQKDADLIHENEVYAIGDADQDGTITLDDAYDICEYYAMCMADADAEKIREEYDAFIAVAGEKSINGGFEGFTEFLQYTGEAYTLDQVTLHLMDADADGDVDIQDGYFVMWGHTRLNASNGEMSEYYPGEGRYDLYALNYALGDIDGDGKITIQDANNVLLYYSRVSAGEKNVSLTEAGDAALETAALKVADVNGDGKITIDDACLILKYYATESAGNTACWGLL